MSKKKTLLILDPKASAGAFFKMHLGEAYETIVVDSEEQTYATLKERNIDCFTFIAQDVVLDPKAVFDSVRVSHTQMPLIYCDAQESPVWRRLESLKKLTPLYSPVDLFSIKAAAFRALSTSPVSAKTISVVVADASDTVRSFVNAGLRTLGIKSIRNAASVEETLNLLEKYHTDIIVSGFFPQNAMNGFNLLDYCISTKGMRHIKVAMMFDKGETEFIPKSYEMGLTSWLPKPITREELVNSIKMMIEEMKNFGDQYIAAASKTYRGFLKETQRIDELLFFEQSLIKAYEGDPKLLVEYAEANYMAGNKVDAGVLGYQAILMDPQYEGLVKDLIGRFDPDLQNEEESKGYKLNSVLIVDSDSIVCSFLEEHLQKLGAEDIHIFNDGESAFEWLKETNQKPEIVFMEWKIPKLTGPFLAQRIRSLNIPDLGIVICSSLVEKSDMALLQELGIDNILDKPLTSNTFFATTIRVLQDIQNPSEGKDLERKILLLLGAGKAEEARSHISCFKALKTTSEPERLWIESNLKYVYEEFEAARNLILKALSLSDQKLNYLNHLGKCLMKLGDFKNASTCFKNAAKLSPSNMERLCNLAMVRSELGDQAGAKSAVKVLEKYDPKNENLLETQAKLAIKEGDTQLAQEVMAELNSVKNIVANMNNKAVMLTKSDQVDDGIELYERTLKSLPKAQKEIRIIVLYNMCLALAKAGKFRKASELIHHCMNDKKHVVYLRALSLSKKLAEAEKTGKIDLNYEKLSDAKALINPLGESGPLKIEGLPTGGRGLYGIYRFHGQLSNDTKEALKTMRRGKKEWQNKAKGQVDDKKAS